jgi:hypothetical protein
MSHPGSHHVSKVSTEDAEAGVNVKMIVTIGAVSLVVFAISAVIGWFLLRANLANIEEDTGIAPQGARIGDPEIGIVEMVPYDEDTRLATWRKGIEERLNGYGWANREKGVVRLPIDIGMKRAIAEAAGPAKAPVPVPPELPQDLGINVPTFGVVPASLLRGSIYQGSGALEGGVGGPVGTPIGAAALPAPKADPGAPVLQEGAAP